MEAYAHDLQQLDKIYRTYEKIYQKYKSVGQIQTQKLEQITENYEYLLLRLLFINPVHLPNMTESYLRKDFHFAMYLSYCYGKVLTKFFQWSLFSLILLFVVIVTLNLTFEILPGSDIQMYVGFSCLFIVLIIFILLRSCLTSAEKRVSPSIYDMRTGELRDIQCVNLLFNQRMGPVDPFSQNQELPRMLYLEFDSKTTLLTAAERK
jgi:hypothetical protein